MPPRQLRDLQSSNTGVGDRGDRQCCARTKGAGEGAAVGMEEDYKLVVDNVHGIIKVSMLSVIGDIFTMQR